MLPKKKNCNYEKYSRIKKINPIYKLKIALKIGAIPKNRHPIKEKLSYYFTNFIVDLDLK